MAAIMDTALGLGGEGLGGEYRERLAELELALDDAGWVRLGSGWGHDKEFTRDALKRITRLSRLMFLSNPLIRNGVMLQAHYVWAQGATIVARDTDVNNVIQKWGDVRQNQQELMSAVARVLKDIHLQITGNMFTALFTNPSTGMVRLRSVDTDEIADIVTNPEDLREPWFYKRQWMAGNSEKTVLYPDWQYAPESKPSQFQIPNGGGTYDINWEAPIHHVKVGGTDEMRWGVPEVYPALDWARAVKEDLEDYATIRRAMARFAWKLVLKGAGQTKITAARQRIESNLGRSGANTGIDTNPPATVGSTWVSSDMADLQPIKTAGAAPSPEEGRRMWLLAAAGLGLPVTMLSGDAAAGSWATAKTLDRPTELKMKTRQALWGGAIKDILNYVVDQAATSANGPLFGEWETDDYTGERTVQVLASKGGEEVDRRIDIAFPDILERDLTDRIQSIVAALTLNGHPDLGMVDKITAVRLLLTTLGIADVDELLEKQFPGGVVPPPPAPPVPPPAPEPAPAPAPPPAPATEGLVEAMREQAVATAALAARPLAIEVKLPEPRRVRKDTTFVTDAEGRITGKTETEAEE